jgi:hypothetical protein
MQRTLPPAERSMSSIAAATILPFRCNTFS